MHLDDGWRSVRLIGNVEAGGADRLPVASGDEMWAGRDAASAAAERTWSRNARLTTSWTNMLGASLLHEMSV